MRVASSFDTSQVTDDHFTFLRYGNRKILVKTPALYKDLEGSARQLFSLSHDDTLVFETSDLDICCGEPGEIHRDTWERIGPLLGTVTIRKADEEGNAESLDEPTLPTPRSSSSPSRKQVLRGRQPLTPILDRSTESVFCRHQRIPRNDTEQGDVTISDASVDTTPRRAPHGPISAYNRDGNILADEDPQLEDDDVERVQDFIVSTKGCDSETDHDPNDEDEGAKDVGTSRESVPEGLGSPTRSRARSPTPAHTHSVRDSNAKKPKGHSRSKSDAVANPKRGKSLSRASSAQSSRSRSIVSISSQRDGRNREPIVIHALPLSERAQSRARVQSQSQSLSRTGTEGIEQPDERDDKLQIKVVHPSSGLEQSYKVRRTLNMGKLLMVACARFGLDKACARISLEVGTGQDNEGNVCADEEETGGASLVECGLDQTLEDVHVKNNARFVVEKDGDVDAD